MSDESSTVKYGLPASDGQRFHANHFVVMQERALFKELYFQRALRVGPCLRAALDALARDSACLAPLAEHGLVAAQHSPIIRSPNDLRAALGL